MNDDPFLDLFALDLPDLTSCAPDLSLAVDLCLASSSYAAALTLARPIAGGAPAWWDDIWDFLGDVWSGAGDLAEKIGRSFSRLWDWIWDRVGGTVRWLYNQVESFSWWLFHQVEHWGGVVRDKVTDIGSWVWKQVEWWGGVVRNKVTDIGSWVWRQIEWWGGVVRDKVADVGSWVWGQVEHWGGVVRDKVTDVGNWVWHQVEHWGGVVRDKVEDVGGWVWDQVEHWGTVVRDKVEDTAGWLKDNILPPIMGAAQSVADVFRDALELVGKTIREALEAIGDKLRDAIMWPWEEIAGPFRKEVESKLAIPMKLFRHEYSSLQEILDDVFDPPPVGIVGLVAGLLLVMILMSAYQSIWKSYVDPYFEVELQDQRGHIGRELLTIGVVQEALNRGFIDPAEADFHLEKAGYGEPAKKALLELRFLLPGPSDLIHMAVREVFNPQLREELTLDAEFPDAFLPWAQKLGYSEEWARNYWADHWDLPSPSQGYEMLHRGEIEMPQLVDLIKALDYAPVWRDKLINIAYNPITRVDLRRLYKSGILNPDQVKDGYKALGYNDEKAGWLRDYTLKYYSPDDKSQLDDMADQSASTFRTAYRRGVITRDDALDRIVAAGYTEEVADFLLSIDDVQLTLNPTTDAGVAVRDLTVPIIRSAYAEKLWDRARAQQELEALGYLAWEADLLLQLEDLATQRELAGLAEAVVKAQYVARAIDRTAASKQLDQLKVLPERRDLLLQRWDLQGAEKTRELTVAQLQRGLRDGLLPEVEVLSRFSGMGYNEANAKFLVDDVDKTPEGKARRLSVSQLSQAYKIGAITDAQLLNGLLDLGYSQGDAQVLVDIATPAPEAKARQLSAGQLSTGFRAGLVTEAELLEGLTALGYAQADAEILRDIAARQPEPAARKLSVAQLTVGFRAGLVTEAELLEKLAALGYPQADVELIRDIAALQPEPAARKLSVANLKDLFKAETIDKAGLLAELLGLGYTDRDAGWIADLIAPEE